MRQKSFNYYLCLLFSLFEFSIFALKTIFSAHKPNKYPYQLQLSLNEVFPFSIKEDVNPQLSLRIRIVFIAFSNYMQVCT